MSGELRFEVLGVPAPQGSKRHVGRGIMVESSKLVAPWRDAVTYKAREAMLTASWATLDGPCSVLVEFWLPRPKTLPKGRTRPDRKPDVDKLLRSTLDALTTSGAIADDARVVDLHGIKHYAGRIFAGTGAWITVRPTETEET